MQISTKAPRAARSCHTVHPAAAYGIARVPSLQHELRAHGNRVPTATNVMSASISSSSWCPGPQTEPDWCCTTTSKYQQLVVQLRADLQGGNASSSAASLSRQLTCIIAEVPACLAPEAIVEHAYVLETMAVQDFSLYVSAGQPMTDALLKAAVTSCTLEAFTVQQLSQLLQSMSTLITNKASLGRLYMAIMQELQSVRPQSVKETDSMRHALLAAVQAGVMETLPPKEWCNLLWELARLGGHASNLPEVWQQGVAAVTEATRTQPQLLTHNHVFTAIQACRRSGHTEGLNALQAALCAALEAGTINESYFL